MVDHPVLLRGIQTNVATLRPTIIERTDVEFVAGLMARMAEGESGLSALESNIITRRDEATNKLKLFQPIQRTFNIALVDAVCDLYGAIGYPRLDGSKIESAGLVVRRLAINEKTGQVIPNAYEGWRTLGTSNRGWVRFQSESEANLDPDPQRRPVFTLGHAALDERLALLQSRPAELTEDVSPLFVAPPHLCEQMNRTVLFGVINVTSGEHAARPDEEAYASSDILPAVPIFLRQGGERNIPYGGYVVDASWANYPSLRDFTLFLRQLAVEFDLFGDSPPAQEMLALIANLNMRMANDSTIKLGDFLPQAVRILVAEEAGKIELPKKWPAISADLAAQIRELLGMMLEARFRAVQPNEGRFDARGRQYAVRAFVRVVHEPGCPPELYWSDYSEPFVIAPWYESSDAPPTLIEVPDAFDKDLLKKLKPNVAFAMPESMFNLINSDLTKVLDGAKPSTSGGIGLGWICSLNITIIFIVAFMLLFTFILVLNIFFQWMLFIKICIPIPKRT